MMKISVTRCASSRGFPDSDVPAAIVSGRRRERESGSKNALEKLSGPNHSTRIGRSRAREVQANKVSRR